MLAASYLGHSLTLAATLTASCRRSVLTVHGPSDQSELIMSADEINPAHWPTGHLLLHRHCLLTQLCGVVQPVEETAATEQIVEKKLLVLWLNRYTD